MNRNTTVMLQRSARSSERSPGITDGEGNVGVGVQHLQNIEATLGVRDVDHQGSSRQIQEAACVQCVRIRCHNLPDPAK